MDMRPETENAVRKVLDCFSGADGGVGFHKFRLLIEEMDKKAQSGDYAAGEILTILTRFAKLLDVADREIGP